jgi:imidazolonepropionase-like amidohydrolase
MRAGCTAAQPATAVVTAERMLDVRAERSESVVQGGRIGDAASADAKCMKLHGMTVLPGLIDMHVHLDSDPTYGGYSGLQFNDRFWSMITVPNAYKMLMAGFTTVRNVGADAWNDVGLRQRSTKARSSARTWSRPGTRSARPAGTAIRPISRHRWTRRTRSTPMARTKHDARCARCASTARR